MRRTHSTAPIERVGYFPHTGRPTEVYLHENITDDSYTDDDGNTVSQYSADEVYFTSSLSKQEIEERFDELWAKAETSERSVEERLAELEDLLGTAIDLILEGDAQ